MNGLPASSCRLDAPVRPVALSPSVSVHVRDRIVSVLKSLFVDVEDFDRVVSTGAGKLDPGALLLSYTLPVSLPILLFVVLTCSASPRSPAEPLDCQSMALTENGQDVGKQHKTLLDGN